VPLQASVSVQPEPSLHGFPTARTDSLHAPEGGCLVHTLRARVTARDSVGGVVEEAPVPLHVSGLSHSPLDGLPHAPAVHSY
jgi:hypothetical protein